MLTAARVASLGIFKDNVCTTRINKEKKFKIKFQVLLKFSQILQDYNIWYEASLNGLLPSLFKLCPWGDKWSHPWVTCFA